MRVRSTRDELGVAGHPSSALRALSPVDGGKDQQSRLRVIIPPPNWRNTMSAFDATIPVLQRTLKALDACLDKAQAHADAVKFDSANLLGSRLAPDMFPLSRQIQIACDFGKSIPSRLAGIEVPKWEDNEVTFADFKARIAKTLAYVSTFKPEQFEGA